MLFALALLTFALSILASYTLQSSVHTEFATLVAATRQPAPLSRGFIVANSTTTIFEFHAIHLNALVGSV
jgi:hypothetical protein